MDSISFEGRGVKFHPDKPRLQKTKEQGHWMFCESDFGAAGGWHLMAPDAWSHGILVAWFAELLAEKSKEWANNSVDDKAMGAKASPAYHCMTAVVSVVIYDG